MADLYAVCRPPSGFEVKSVQLNNQIQADLDHIMQAQEYAFLEGIQAEIPFTGDWKPDPDELLVIQNLPEATILLQASAQNALALAPLNPHGFLNERVVGLFIGVGTGPNRRLLLQNFSAQQILETKIAVMFDGNVFRRITEPAFTIAGHLTAIINAAGEVKFKSYSAMRRILDIAPVFQQATDIELTAFCIHQSLFVANAQAFIAGADEGIRKQVHAITATGVLGQHTVPAISTMAAAIGFQLPLNAGRIEIPPNRREAKALFSFLLDKVYRGPINHQLLITNSTRPL